jgi:hypothetical protein
MVPIGADTGEDVILGDNGFALFDAVSGRSVLREIRTSDVNHGGDDWIFAADGFDVVLGGSGGDMIDAGTDGSRDVVLGDNGYALLDENEVLVEIASTDPSVGGDDDIVVGDGNDIVVAGVGTDYVNVERATGLTIGIDSGEDVILGDNGFAKFDAVSGRSVLREIRTSDVNHGGDDWIFAADGFDVVLGGSGGDMIDAGTDGSRDVVLGDNGYALLDENEVLVEIASTDPSVGGKDTITTDNGPDVVLGGVADDVILAGGDDYAKDYVIGDSGRMTFEGTETYDMGEEFAVLSFNFHDGSDSTEVTGPAGAPGGRSENWNNMKASALNLWGDQAEEQIIFDDGLIAPGVKLEWGRNLDSDAKSLDVDTHGQIHPEEDQDKRLFEGYLHTSTKNTVGINLTGLNHHFRSYEVYVYLDADDKLSEPDHSVRRLTDGQTTYYLDDPDGNTFSGDYVQATSTDPDVPEIGNYVVFSGLTHDAFEVRIEDDSTLGNGSKNMPGVTAIQVVGRRQPIDRFETVSAEFGGNDKIFTGGGPDLVFGGSGSDLIETFGVEAAGRVDADVVAGDNARGTMMRGELRNLVTTAFESSLGETSSGLSEDDVILTGNGEDLVLGGNGNDSIDTGVQGIINNGDVQILSINLAGDVHEGLITGVAGAVAAMNWNNLAGSNGGNQSQESTDLLFGDGRLASGVGVVWGKDLDSSNTKEGNHGHHGQLDPDTQNQRLFNGYDYTSASQTLGLDVTGLNSHYGLYDVYVYIDADDGNSSGEHSVRRLTDGVTEYYLDDPDGNTFTGMFVEASSTDPLSPAMGNYVVFRDVTSDTFSLRIDDDRELPGQNRSQNHPSLTGLQFVGGPDKDQVIIGGDFDRDSVLGDNGRVHRFAGQIYEIFTTDHSAVDAGVQEDCIQVGDGADLVIAGNGDDSIQGEEGDDLMLGDNARLLLFEGDVIGSASGGVFKPYDVFGIQLLSDSIGGEDVFEGNKDDDLIYGQFGNDSFVFAGGGLGNDRLVEAGNSNSRPNDLHDRLDFSRFINTIEVNLEENERQSVNGKKFEGDTNLTAKLFSGTAFEDVTGSEFSDEIEGNVRDNTLVGLSGKDDVDGKEGNDLLIGGDDADELEGDDGRDIVIGTFTLLDEDPVALQAILTVWNSDDDYTTRIDTIRTGSGPVLKGVKLEAETTVLDDGFKDELEGDDNRDWFFAQPRKDDVDDRDSGEALDVLIAVGDLNRDGLTNAEDIDLLCEVIFNGGAPIDWRHDLVVDAVIDRQDVDWLVRGILEREYGDSNLDGRIDLSDYNTLAGHFDPVGENPNLGWSQGDFDGDDDVDLADYMTLATNFDPTGNTSTAPTDSQISGDQEPESELDSPTALPDVAQSTGSATLESPSSRLALSPDTYSREAQQVLASHRQAAELTALDEVFTRTSSTRRLSDDPSARVTGPLNSEEI